MTEPSIPHTHNVSAARHEPTYAYCPECELCAVCITDWPCSAVLYRSGIKLAMPTSVYVGSCAQTACNVT